MILRKLFNLLYKLNKLDTITSTLEQLQLAIGRLEIKYQSLSSAPTLHDYECKVFSQWGEDGIIQYLIKNIPIPHKFFIEFGVQRYTESNTRFLLINNNWSGLVIDASSEDIHSIKNDKNYIYYDLTALNAFVDRENINDLITSQGISGDIGLLSIDIDGNDYWVWEAISCIAPRLVICEYNSLFGARAKVTIPYDKDFQRTTAHFSNLYYGASIAALEYLGKSKGYSLLGSNSAGNNLFFVRNDLEGELSVVTSEAAYVKAKFRESRHPDGALTFLDFNNRLKLIEDMVLIEVEQHTRMKVKDLGKE